jgi:hypothetical protein
MPDDAPEPIASTDAFRAFTVDGAETAESSRRYLRLPVLAAAAVLLVALIIGLITAIVLVAP